MSDWFLGAGTFKRASILSLLGDRPFSEKV